MNKKLRDIRDAISNIWQDGKSDAGAGENDVEDEDENHF